MLKGYWYMIKSFVKQPHEYLSIKQDYIFIFITKNDIFNIKYNTYLSLMKEFVCNDFQEIELICNIQQE